MREEVFKELAGLTTEAQNPDTSDLDKMSVREILEAMNREDRKIHAVIEKALPEIEQAVDLVVAALRRGGRLIYVGAGTSGRLGVMDAAECPPTFGTEPHRVLGLIAGGYEAMIHAVEGAEDNLEQAAHDLDLCAINEEDVVIGISASRRTPYVLGALSYAGEHKAKRVLLICNMWEAPPNALDLGGTKGGASVEIAEVIISLPVGPEVLTGSTRLKAGTATKLVLNMISTASWVRMGKCYGNLMIDLRQGSLKLQARARKILMQITDCDYEWADELLKQAGGELKTALVMHWKGVEAEHARELLSDAGGEIGKIIQTTNKT